MIVYLSGRFCHSRRPASRSAAEGVAVDERPVLRTALGRASEVFFTGTSAEVMPVVRIDGDVVGGGTPGPIARRLRAAFPRLR